MEVQDIEVRHGDHSSSVLVLVLVLALVLALVLLLVLVLLKAYAKTVLDKGVHWERAIGGSI